MKAPKLFQRLTPFQIAVTGLILLCLGSNIGVIAVLLRTRAEAQPVLSRSDSLVELADQGPYIREAAVKALLALAADEVAELAEGHIEYTVHISETMPLSVDIAVNEQIPVPISLVVSDTVPIHAEIPIQEKVLVPVNLNVDREFSVDITVPFNDEIVVPIDDVVHIDEKFRVRLLGQDFDVPIRGDIPVRLNVTATIDKEFPVRADVPIAFPISETLAVEISWTIPVDLNIPVHLPVETEVIVPFSRTIPLNLKIPVVFDVPIRIALADTSLGEYLRGLGETLLMLIPEDTPRP